MILLDTDHLTVLKYSDSPKQAALVARLDDAADDVGTTVVSLEEQFRGWFAEVARLRDVRLQVRPYTEVLKLQRFFADWEVLPFDEAAAAEFERMRRAGVRIGSMDLKIACIALVSGAMLLTANARDFGRVPGLRTEDWTADPR